MSEGKVQKRPAATGGGDDVAAVIAEYRSACRYRRLASLLVVIAILGVVLTLAYLYYSYGRKVVKEITVAERFTSLQKRVNISLADLRPKVEKEAQALWPELRAIAQQKAEAARPELEKVFNTEAETFKKNMQTMLEEKIKAAVEGIINENKDTLQKDFPGITDPEKMEALVNMLVDATQTAAFNVFSPRFKEHEDVLKSIDEKRTKLPLMEASYDLILMKTTPAAPAEGGAAQPAAKPAPAPASAAPVAAPAPAPAPAQ
jgi:hypothetical protein